MNRKQPVIFCDFDGTITVNDNIVAIMKHFQPTGWDTLVNQVINREITVQEGVGRMFSLLPSSRKEEVVQYALDNIRIRPGFQELLDYCKEQDIKFLVTSGGIDFFVYPTLQPFGIRQEDIFCNRGDFQGEQVLIEWPHPCDEECENGCGMCKTTIIRSYPRDEYLRILIGDSITDFAGAQLADVVFARSHLLDRCEELKMPHHPYDDFHQLLDGLQTILRK